MAERPGRMASDYGCTLGMQVYPSPGPARTLSHMLAVTWLAQDRQLAVSDNLKPQSRGGVSEEHRAAYCGL